MFEVLPHHAMTLPAGSVGELSAKGDRRGGAEAVEGGGVQGVGAIPAFFEGGKSGPNCGFVVVWYLPVASVSISRQNLRRRNCTFRDDL